jgi:histidine ammonia-lyase
MMGEGKMWDPKKKEWGSAAEVLKQNNLEPIQLEAKEGLAMINGTQFIVTFAAEALYRAENLSLVADICGAMTLEALKGSNFW